MNIFKSKYSRLFTILATIVLVTTFFTPIWSIDLIAPQYPEGLGLEIFLDTIQGQKNGDLQSINKLNQYIGMKEIDPEIIPELDIMPYFMAFMIFSGVILGFINNKKLKYTWIILFIIAGTIGLYDYYEWGYDYGHDLDPNAIIKVPGMSYQPPLIGTKQLLNFKASSYPESGFVLILISLGLMIFSIYLQNNKKNGNDNNNENSSTNPA